MVITKEVMTIFEKGKHQPWGKKKCFLDEGVGGLKAREESFRRRRLTGISRGGGVFVEQDSN